MTTPTSHRRFRPRMERLEERDVPSFGAVGPEFRVNTYTTGNQAVGRMAVDADGNFVVVWSSFGQDGSGWGVYAQRFNSAGVAIGGEFQVNTYTSGVQARATVAMDADGNTVVVWNGETGSGSDVFAQRYNSAGVALGGEFRVNTYSTHQQVGPAIAMDADGAFVVAWSSGTQTGIGQDGSGYGVYAQRFSSAGIPLGGEFRVNTYTTGEQREPSLALDADGAFVVTWMSRGQDGSNSGIFAQSYNSAGASLGSEFRVNSLTTTYLQESPMVAVDANGDSVIAWTRHGYLGGGNTDIYARRYNSAGAAIGAEFRVNSYTTSDQDRPAVAMEADGDFVVVWSSYPQDGSSLGVYAQRYKSIGALQGGEFRVNSYTTGNQNYPSLALHADGDFQVAWSSYGQDGSNSGVYVQQYHANRPPTTSGFPNITIPTAPSTPVNLAPGFADADDGLGGLTFTIANNTNPALFTSTPIAGSTLNLNPAGKNGTATLTVRATDPDGALVETSFTVTVSATAPTVSGTQVNGGALQRSRVTTIDVTFSTQVTFAGSVASAFTLMRTGGGAVSFTATANVVGGVTVVTLNAFIGAETESSSLRDGRYTLTALASQISAGGQQMAANYTFGDAQGLFRFYGDMNGDRRVDIADFGFFSLAYLQTANYNPALDFNGDGRIDISDFGQFSVRFFTSLP